MERQITSFATMEENKPSTLTKADASIIRKGKHCHSGSSSFDSSSSSSSSNLETATSTAKMSSKKRPLQATKDKRNGLVDRRLKRIRNIHTFSIDNDDDNEEIPARKTILDRHIYNSALKKQPTNKLYANDIFEFGTVEEILANPKYDEEAESLLLDMHRAEESKYRERFAASPMCFVVGGGEKPNLASSPFSSIFRTEAPESLNPLQTPSLQASPMENRTDDTVNTGRRILAYRQSPASFLLQQSSPYTTDFSNAPNKDGQKIKSNVPEWDSEHLRMSPGRPNKAKIVSKTSLQLINSGNPDVPSGTKSGSSGSSRPLTNKPLQAQATMKYIPGLYGLPLPESMKPIVRILLYLEEHYHHDATLVRDAFAIVQTCYNKANKGVDVNGSIFESLVENLGDRVDLATVFRAAPTVKESSKLDTYFGGTKEERSKNDEVQASAFFPTLLQLGIAYGIHCARSGGPDGLCKEDNIQEVVCKGAEAVCAMTIDEKAAFWKKVVDETPTGSK